MLISVIAVGKKEPDWINQGVREYSKRLSGEVKIKLIEVAAVKRRKTDNTDMILQKEARNILAAIPRGTPYIAMDEHGKQLPTTGLSTKLDQWINEGSSPCLVIGGADGLHPAIKQDAVEVWALSKLTLPHGLSRLLLVEQIYRAWTILKNHPYHRI